MTFLVSAYVKQGGDWVHLAQVVEAADPCLAVYGFWLKIGRTHPDVEDPLEIREFTLKPMNPTEEARAQA